MKLIGLRMSRWSGICYKNKTSKSDLKVIRSKSISMRMNCFNLWFYPFCHQRLLRQKAKSRSSKLCWSGLRMSSLLGVTNPSAPNAEKMIRWMELVLWSLIMRKGSKDMQVELKGISAWDVRSVLGSLDITIHKNFWNQELVDVANGLIASLRCAEHWVMMPVLWLTGLIMYGQSAILRRLENGLI